MDQPPAVGSTGPAAASSPAPSATAPSAAESVAAAASVTPPGTRDPRGLASDSGLGDPLGRRADVEVRLPADGAFASVLRTVASGLAVRLDFTIDDIEDLRMAVSEACALVLPHADEGADLHAAFHLSPDEIVAVLSVAAQQPEPTDPDAWAWQVLTALTAGASQSGVDGRFAVSMTVRSSTPRSTGSKPRDTDR